MWGFWLLIILLLLFAGTLPAYPYSRRWGYTPSATFGAGLLFVLILMWFGFIAFAWPWAAPVY